MKLYLVFQSLTKKERRVFISAFALFLFATIIWAVHFFYTHTVAVPAAGGDYTEGIIGQPTFINPILAGSNDVDRDLVTLLYDNLFNLVDHYKTSTDGKTWNITLKNNLRWSDDKPLTSDDVVFTIEAIQDLESRSPLFLTWQGVVVQRVSELEVEFNLRTPYTFFLDNLKDLKIAPKHIFSTIPNANLRLSNYNLEPIGSGPYKFVTYNKRKDGFITDYQMDINPRFASTTPFLNTFTIKFFPGTKELIQAFNSRKIDGFGDMSPKNLGELRLSNQIIEIPMPRYYAVFLNKNSHPALQDNTVRQALFQATNKAEIIANVFQGKALSVNGPLLPIIAGYSESANALSFSVEQANALLESNGWLKNGEGIREKKIGKDIVQLKFDLIVPQIPFLSETAELLRQQWQQIGVALNILLLNPTDITNEVIKTRNYQMILFGNILKENPDIFSFWHSSERFYPGLNLSLYENKRIDGLLESIRKNVNNESRNRDLGEIQKVITNDLPAIFLFSPTYLYIAPKSFGGLPEQGLTTAADRFLNVNQWFIKTSRVFK